MVQKRIKKIENRPNEKSIIMDKEETEKIMMNSIRPLFNIPYEEEVRNINIYLIKTGNK